MRLLTLQAAIQGERERTDYKKGSVTLTAEERGGAFIHMSRLQMALKCIYFLLIILNKIT